MSFHDSLTSLAAISLHHRVRGVRKDAPTKAAFAVVGVMVVQPAAWRNVSFFHTASKHGHRSHSLVIGFSTLSSSEHII